MKWVTFIKIGRKYFPASGNDIPIITKTIRINMGLNKAMYFWYKVPPFKIAHEKAIDNKAITTRNT